MPLTLRWISIVVCVVVAGVLATPALSVARTWASPNASFAAMPGMSPPQQGTQDDGVSLDGLGHDRGTSVAKNWVAEFLDFGCGYCAKFALETYPAIDKEFIASGKVRWKIVPFVSGQFPNSEEAAVSAECAGEQGKFPAMHDSLLASRKEWMKSDKPQDVFVRIGRTIGLNAAAAAKCATGDQARFRVRKQTMIAKRVNIRGTPTFFINGERIEGAVPLPLFRQVMQQLTK
ncbi:MAG: thioredoxin domain-containing protein [Gemmatimonadaceae bacterium]